jgi:hypothetical protein
LCAACCGIVPAAHCAGAVPGAGLEGDDGGEQAGPMGAAGEGAAELDGVHGYVLGAGLGWGRWRRFRRLGR